MSRLTTAAIKLSLRRTDKKQWGELARQAENPDTTQRDVLLDILKVNADTSFGLAHSFDEIRSGSDFAEAVPVNTYIDLKDAIEQQERESTPELTAETPILYTQTSGTTGTPKYLPVTQSGLARQARAQRLLASMIGRYTNIFAGRILGVGSPAIEGRLPSGKPFGSASGLIFDGMPRMIRSRYVLTDDIIAIEDYEQRYFEIAKVSLAARNLSAIGTANPSTILRLHQTLVERWDELVAAVEVDLPVRGRELRALKRTASSTFDELWPDLEVLTAWTCGSCGLALERLAPLLPTKLNLFELGYSASELRGSVATEPGRSDSVPLLGDVYFEFVERESWEAKIANFVGLADLALGKQYYVFVTTIDGLYRYDMNDILETVDQFHETPTIQFVQKGTGVTNITGEKLYEAQLIAALQRGGGGRLPGAGFFMGLADAASATYRIFVEGPLATDTRGLAMRVDEALCDLNIEYGAKRRSGRLHSAEIFETRPGTAIEYRAHCVAAGQRDSQFKAQYLQSATDCSFDFESRRVYR